MDKKSTCTMYMNFEKCNTALPKNRRKPISKRFEWNNWQRVWCGNPFFRFDQIDWLGATQSDRMKRNKMRRDAKGTDFKPSHNRNMYNVHCIFSRANIHFPLIWYHIWQCQQRRLSISCVSCYWASETLESCGSWSGPVLAPAAPSTPLPANIHIS